jgi:hypothetical protein
MKSVACPQWCTDHHDEQHSAVMLWSKRFPHWEVPTAVVVSQRQFQGVPVTRLSVWLQSSRARHHEVPPSHDLSITEARQLIDGLTRAVALLESLWGDCCVCGDRHDVEHDQCCICGTHDDDQHQRRLRVVWP